MIFILNSRFLHSINLILCEDSRDWKVWFNDTKDYKTNKLVKHMDVVNTTVLGMINVRKKEKYALLGSEHQLTHIVRTNFSE